MAPANARRLSDPTDHAEGHQPFLLFSDRDGRQQRFAFTPGMESVTVGRGSSSDLVLNWDAQVSRVHARFERVAEGWELIDGGLSRNGTFVNDRRLSGRHRLNDGDVVRFGRTVVTFRSPQRVEAPKPPPEPPRAAVSLSTNQRRVLAALCRPCQAAGHAVPATDEQIADELVLSVSEVRAHLRVLYAKLELGDVPQEQRRVGLVRRAFSLGLVPAADR